MGSALRLAGAGRLPSRATAFAFADYAELVARRLGDRVKWWITLNEPWCSAYFGYGLGVHAPGIEDMQAAVNAAHTLLLAHGLATVRLRAYVPPQAQIGITLNLTAISAADTSAEAMQGVTRADALNNRWFLDPLFRGSYPEHLFADLGVAPPPSEAHDMALIATPLDFLGVNYYSRALYQGRSQKRLAGRSPEPYAQVIPVPGASYTDMAWEIYPQGLGEVLGRVRNDYAPPALLVTENGAAFEDSWDGKASVPDTRRARYLREHLAVLEEAVRRGIPVRGYFAWSLLDNYEWTDGYSKRFGLVYVDYATQRRIVKESGRWYAAFIAAQRQGVNG